MNNLEINNRTIYNYGKYRVMIVFSKDNFKRNFKPKNIIINNNPTNKGAFSSIKKIYSRKKFMGLFGKKGEEKDIILKNTELDNEGNEINGLIFHMNLEENYKNDNKSLKYLCTLYQFGFIMIGENPKRLYSIIEKCGINLYKYFGELKEKNSRLTKLTKIVKLIHIFKECCEAVKIIHDMGYLHLDIKPENFMIKDNQVKIIDFGIVKENKYETLPTFGTSKYIASDWIINKRNNVMTTLTYHHDIFSLGCMFIELLYGYVFGKYIEMACPIINEGQLRTEIINYRASYPERYEEMLETIRKDCNGFN